ncbi:unnamed protein product [Absidia cylindrospora]
MLNYLGDCIGTRYPAPARVEASGLNEGKDEIRRIRQQIREAQNILIVGGGPVGIELAGEIRDTYNKDDKKVTLIHSQPQLGNASYMPTKVHHKLLGMMMSSDIDVLLNDKVDLPAPANEDQKHNVVYIPSTPLPVSKQGHDISNVDFVLMANGNKPDAGWVEASFAALIQADGYVKVKPTLQVDHPTLASKVFVMGDIAGLDETKLAFRTVAHSSVVSANIAKLLQQPDTPENSLKHYKKGVDMMLITFGKNKGVTILPWGIVMGNWISSTLKSKTLFIDRYWKELNQTAPRSSTPSSSIPPSSSNKHIGLLLAVSIIAVVGSYYY